MATPSRGSVDPPEDQHPGDHETRTVIIMRAAKEAEVVAAQVAQLLGLASAVNGIMTTTGPMDTTVGSRTMATEALLPPGLLLGIKRKPLEHNSSTEAILVVTLGIRQWAPLLALEPPLPPRLTI